MIFSSKPVGKRPLERPWHRLEVIMIQSMNIYLQDLWFENMSYVQLAQDKGLMVGCCAPGNELSGSVKVRNFMAF
jgi:phage terminase large subunit